MTPKTLCVSVLLNTQETPVTIKRRKKRGYALPLNTECQKMGNLKKFKVIECPLHGNRECILKRINKLKDLKRCFVRRRRQTVACLVVQTFLKDQQIQN